MTGCVRLWAESRDSTSHLSLNFGPCVSPVCDVFGVCHLRLLALIVIVFNAEGEFSYSIAGKVSGNTEILAARDASKQYRYQTCPCMEAKLFKLNRGQVNDHHRYWFEYIAYDQRARESASRRKKKNIQTNAGSCRLAV
jgi:hypothetical protein